jgi:phosphoribosylformimino-5-aminoimidazole carboxamide ribotide isomerase
MLIIPAIDIKNAQCVRLFKGNYENFKIYSTDPVNVAFQWKDAGAEILHIIDLDAAKEGKLVNFNIIKKIKKLTNLKLEVGGGIRNLENVKSLLNEGIDYIIISTAAIENPNFLDQLQIYKEKILVSIDIKNNQIMKKGWLENSNINLNDFIKTLLEKNFNQVIITDISKDGTLAGINIEIFKNISNSFPNLNITIAGGVSSINDIEIIKNSKINNLRGIIIGKALYEGKIDLKKLLLKE